MSNTKKILILVVLVLVFSALLLLGHLFETNGQADPSKSKLGSIFEPIANMFVPSIPLKNIKCNNQNVTSDFSLSGNSNTCRMRLKPARDDDYGKARINVVAGDAKLYFVARLEERKFPKAKRDKSRYLLSQNELRKPYVLVRWEPKGGDDPRSPNWLAYILTDSPGDLTTLEEGGNLTLECVGCETSTNVKLRMH